MRKLQSLISGLLLILFLGSAVLANEGVFEFQSVNSSGASCYVLSVYDEGGYDLVGTCRGLQTPFSAEQNRFVLWKIEDDDSVVRIGELKNGKIDRSTTERFKALMVTAEGSGSPRKPSTQVVARGDWQAVPLVGEEKRLEEVKTTPTPTASLTKTDEVKTDEQKTSTLSKVLGTIGKIVGIGFLVLLIGVVVMTVVTRRKETT